MSTPTDKVTAALDMVIRLIEYGDGDAILDGSATHGLLIQARAEIEGKVLIPLDRSRNQAGVPNTLWISREALELTLEDCKEGEGIMYVLPTETRQQVVTELMMFMANKGWLNVHTAPGEKNAT